MKKKWFYDKKVVILERRKKTATNITTKNSKHYGKND